MKVVECAGGKRGLISTFSFYIVKVQVVTTVTKGCIMSMNSETTKQALNRVFGDIRSIEAEADLYVPVKAIDKEGAIQHDLENCVFSKACHRAFDSTRVLFLARVAYVDLIDPDTGERTVNRFAIPDKTRLAIEAYDVDGVFKEGVYLLKKPAPSYTRDARRTQQARYRKNPALKKKNSKQAQRRHARIKAKATRVKTINKAGITGFIRTGAGLIHTQVINKD